MNDPRSHPVSLPAREGRGKRKRRHRERERKRESDISSKEETLKERKGEIVQGD